MKRAVRILLPLLGALAVSMMAVVWLTASESGFRALAAALAAVSGERIKIENIEGHLGVPLSIGKITYAGEARRIELEAVRLEWRPAALWQRRLEIDLIAAQTLRVTILKPDTALPQVPASLRLPLRLQVHGFDLAHLHFVQDGDTLSLNELRGKLEDDGNRYRLQSASMHTPWANVSGQADIGKDAPFVLDGALAASRDEPVPMVAKLEVSGELSALTFRLKATAENMRLFASGKAAPFAAVRLPRLLVAGEGVDPRLFAATAPAADLAFAGLFEGRADARLFGTFSLNNRLSGRLEQNRLPLVSLTGAVLGDLARAEFQELMIDLGNAGQFGGDGRWADGRLSLDLVSENLDLSGLHGKLYTTRLKTALHLSGDKTRQQLKGEVSESWGQGRFALALADEVLRLEEADFAGEAGRLQAHGTLELAKSRGFELEFDASQINPARFGKFPHGRLNARGEISGALSPDLQLDARLVLPPGVLEAQAVRGQGVLRYEKRHLARADVDLDLAGNRIQLKGAYGRAGDRLEWDIDAPSLARLNLGVAGRLASRGTVSGEPSRPQIRATAVGSGLRLPGGIAADTLNLDLDLQAAADGAFNGKIDARGVSVAGQRVDAVRVLAKGLRSAHELSLDARLPKWRLTAALAGGLDAQWTWRGRISQAALQGQWPVRLDAPASLVLARDRQQASNVALSAAGGRLTLAHFSREGGRMASRGELAALPLAPLLSLIETELPFGTDLRLDGEWDLRLSDKLDGRLNLRRRTGDIRLEQPAQDIGLTTLTLALAAEAGRISARFDAASREAGQLQAQVQTTLMRDGAGLALPRSAPLTWQAQLDVPSLRLLRPLLPVGMRADASIRAELGGSGSLAAPHIDGSLVASAIRFAVPEQGIAITDGTLKLLLADDRMRVAEGVLHGQSGRIILGGEAAIRNPQAGLTLTFDKFAATNRSDRRVIVSGTGKLAIDQKRLRLEGELVADRARIERPEAGRPALSADVVVAGRVPAGQSAAGRIPLDLDLKLGLGDDFIFKGAGLDVRLGGQLRVFTQNGALRGEGRIQAEKGQYSAYGQRLEIERGVLNFSGPLDNPGLDVLAVRKTPAVKAGVQVRGSVQRPLVTLYSDPPMPDGEKLSWLVLGHGLDKGGRQEFALLQLAAGALLGQAESASVQSQMAGALGLDSFEVRGGEGEDLTSAVVGIGRRISSHATLGYEQSLDGLNQVVKVMYELTTHLRVEAKAGQSNSIDVFYTREYD